MTLRPHIAAERRQIIARAWNLTYAMAIRRHRREMDGWAARTRLRAGELVA